MPVSLHTHSWYSLLEGVTSIEGLVDRAAASGYRALALTDSNNLYGAVRFTELAHRHGIRPLLGACLRQHRSRCVALIAERAGYRSLCRVISRLNLEGVEDRGRETEDRGSRIEDCESEPAGEERPSAAGGPSSSILADLLADNAEGLHVLVDDPALAE